jgi:hypothetical protein
MNRSGNNHVNLVIWLNATELENLKEICRFRDCSPEELLRELALCEIARYRCDKYVKKLETDIQTRLV